MLEARILGQFRIQTGEVQVDIPSRPAQSLFAYLLINAGVSFRREKLAGLLWPEAMEENARGYLRSALWRIRKALETAGLSGDAYLEIGEIAVMFRKDAEYWLDFNRLLERKQGQIWTTEELIDVVSLYQGGLLPGFYDEWVVLERERARAAFDHKMKLLLERLIGEQRWDEVLEWGERWIALGQVPEGAYRALMIAHTGMGDLSSMALIYQRCAEAFERELGLEPSEELQELYADLKRGKIPAELAASPLAEAEQEAVKEQPPAAGEAPFKGLEFFDVEDADLFFGREALTAKLVAHLRESRFLAVVGASGSGKSSVVRAGLVCGLKCGKTLADGSLPPKGSDSWLVHIITPGAHLLEALAASLSRDEESVAATGRLIDDLVEDERSLHLYTRRQAERHKAGRLLLVVDQFEELFTLCRDESERAAFIANLVYAAKGERSGQTVVVIALRADFYAHCSQYPELRLLLAQHQEYIGPMSSEELRRAIEEPALQTGWEFQPGLVDLILHDAQGEPGALPLLSHALLETWGRRSGRMMTLKGYAEAGGVRGAIARTADTVFNHQLNEEQQKIARSVFLRLTELGEGTQDTRRRAGFAELVPYPEAVEEVQEVLEALAEARLVTLSEESAEVAHEALIREWPRLHEWLVQDRQSLLTHRHLTEAAQQWEGLERDEGELYRGGRLSQAIEWAEGHGEEMNQLEREFVGASQELAERQAAEREAQRQRELEAAQKLAETQARSNRRLRVFAIGLSLVLIAAIVAASLAYQQSRRANNEARLSSSRELAAAAVSNQGADPELSLALALEAVSEAQTAGLPVPREAEEALHAALPASRLKMVLSNQGQPVRAASFTLDGQIIVAGGLDGVVRLWDADTGKEILTINAHQGAVTSLAFDPGGKRFATSGADRKARIWDLESGKQLLEVQHDIWIAQVTFSPDGKHLATAGWDHVARVWDSSNGKELLTLEGHDNVIFGIAFSPDGKRLATAGWDELVIIWEVGTGEVLSRLEAGTGLTGTAFSPDGSILAAGGADGKVILWNTNDWSPRPSLAGLSDVVSGLRFNADGTRLATASGDRRVNLWDVDSSELLLVLSGNQGPLMSVDISLDGSRLISGSADGTVRVWDLSPGREWLALDSLGGAGRITYSPDGSLLAAGTGPEGLVKVWGTATGEEVLSLGQAEDGHSSWVESTAFSPDGALLATASLDGTARIWDVGNGRLVHTLAGHVGPVYDQDFSPDGRWLATLGADTVVMIWDVATGQRIKTISTNSDGTSLDYSPDGSRIAVTSYSGIATLWDSQSGERLLTIGEHSGVLEGVAFSPDGSRLALASTDNTASIWDLAAGKPPLILRGHSAPVMSVAFSPDGKRVATVGRDSLAILWDAATGEELLRFSGQPDNRLVGVSFSPDGRQLATSGDKAVQIYLLNLDELVQLAEQRLARPLTREECLRYLREEKCRALAAAPTLESVPEIQVAADSPENKVCMVTDAPIPTSPFMQIAYQGVLAVEGELNWSDELFEAQVESDLLPNMEQATQSNCDLILPMGFYYNGRFPDLALDHPGQKFLVLDYNYDPPLDNLWAEFYATDQAAFLAGYLAAGISQTGKVATFGALNWTVVTDFMDGFALGVRRYNQVHEAQVELLGWDVESREGDFAGGFLPPELGTQLANQMLEQGADVIFPVAGADIGLAAAQAVKEHGNAYFIGVDFDSALVMPDLAKIILTSVLKHMDVSVLQAIEAIENGSFQGGVHIGTLESGEVGLAPFHQLDLLVPDSLKAELEQIKTDIIAGKIKTKP